MKKIISFIIYNILIINSYSQCPNGEIEVNLEIHTDDWGYECYWQLVPNGNNCGVGTLASGGNNSVGCNGGGQQNQASGGYNNNTTVYEGPYCLTENNNFDLIYVDDWGDGGGEFDVLISGYPKYTFSGTGNGNTFTFNASEPLTEDISGIEITNNGYIYIEPNVIKGILKNVSSTSVNSFDLTYTINNGTPRVANISGLNWQPFTTYNFEHSDIWEPNWSGDYTIKVWASNINGSPDMDTSNDEIEKTVTVGPGIPNIIDQYINTTPIFTIIGDISDLVIKPTDLDFHPTLTNFELWVTLKGTEASGGKTVTFYNAGKTNQTHEVKQDGNAWHFMSLPTGIAFSENGNFATCPGVYDANHQASPPFGMPFTGPSLWSSDPNIYAQPSGGNGSHIDMLHVSPYSQGIASEADNVFWVFDGHSNDIVRYDFQDDHGPGNSYHGDAIVRRYSDEAVLRDPNHNAPSHLILKENWLYIADFGNNRVIKIDINTGSVGNNSLFGPYEDLAEYSSISGYIWETVVSTGLTGPSGIDIIEDRMIVSEFQSGEIVIYDINTGSFATELERINTGTSGVAGVKIGPNGKIWYVNQNDNTVIRIDGAGIGLNETQNTSNRKVVKVIDNLGREVPSSTKNQLLFFIYDNGSVEKVFNQK